MVNLSISFYHHFGGREIFWNFFPGIVAMQIQANSMSSSFHLKDGSGHLTCFFLGDGWHKPWQFLRIPLVHLSLHLSSWTKDGSQNEWGWSKAKLGANAILVARQEIRGSKGH